MPPSLCDGREADTGLPLRLVKEGFRFDFFQAVHLLERHFRDAPTPGTSPDLKRERIRFRTDPAIRFPPTDVSAIRMNDHAEVTLTFMGLYGVDSPLPSFVSEAAQRENVEGQRLRDFLDMFAHRFYAFYYRAWRKCRLDLHPSSSSIVRSVSGLGTPEALSDPGVVPALLMSLSGRLASRARTAEGLCELLSSLVRMPVRIEENVERWVRLRTRPQIGGAFRLGGEATVGPRIRDRAGKFRVHFGPLDLREFIDFLPDGASAAGVRWLTRNCAPDYLEYDVALHLRAETMRPARLGDAACRLGRTSCLGQPPRALLTRIVRYE